VISIILATVLMTTPAKCEVTRSRAQVEAFKKANPCPKTCATYVFRNRRWTMYERCGACNVDHICPLACCGADHPSNMQWLDAKENKAKGADCSFCGKP
jgi:hypothetical protein